MPSIVIVNGPRKCGKTRNKAALKEMFRANAVVDSWDGRPAALSDAVRHATNNNGRALSWPERDQLVILVLTDLAPDDKFVGRTVNAFLSQGFSVKQVEFATIEREATTLQAEIDAAPANTGKMTTKRYPSTFEEGSAVVQLSDLPNKPTTLVVQDRLLTRIETSVTREQAVIMAATLIEHFEMTPHEIAKHIDTKRVSFL